MPITYPILMPTQPGMVDFAWENMSAVAEQSNEFNLKSRIYEWEGQLRRAVCTIGEMKSEDNVKQWQAFLGKLNGTAGSFLLHEPKNDSRHRGNYDLGDSYVGRVKGGDQNSSDLVTDGWDPGMVGALLQGDWISINYRLYQLLDDVDVDSSGDATLSIWPHVRPDVPDNAEISVGEQAWGEFRMIEWPRQPFNVETLMSGFAFSCKEAK